MKKLLFILATLVAASCSSDVEPTDIFSNFTANISEVPADGQSTVIFSVELTDDADSDRRNIIFKTSSGILLASGTNTAIVKAEYENGVLIAKATLRVSTTPGDITVNIKPEFDSSIAEFTLQKVITTTPSEPATLTLDASSFGIASNFLNEVKVVGSLRNSAGGYVSKGYEVQFEDLLSNGIPAGGQFREVRNTTADSSKVSCIYSATQHPIGTQIIIKSTLTTDNNKTDSIILTINQ